MGRLVLGTGDGPLELIGSAVEVELRDERLGVGGVADVGPLPGGIVGELRGVWSIGALEPCDEVLDGSAAAEIIRLGGPCAGGGSKVGRGGVGGDTLVALIPACVGPWV